MEYHPAIEDELRKIINYYNDCSTGLGTESLNEFEHQVLKIAANPFRWVAVKGAIRRSLMHRFPYVIYFRVVNDQTLRVTVVKHQCRHPKRGISRR
ncbi:MAG: type II toxin-antitoxin system RelE/ParE family toxin [Chlorobaculum sp.]|nr:type II toxin-antitoxin system RelE/ParE family toxin [Chlorobaculum sp.]